MVDLGFGFFFLSHEVKTVADIWDQKICSIQISEPIISFAVCITYVARNCVAVKGKKCNDLNSSMSSYCQMNRPGKIAEHS